MVGDDLLAVVNDVQFFGVDPSAVSRVFLFVSQGVMVSARTTQVRAIDRLRTSIKDGEEFRSTVDLLAHLLRDQADVLVDIVRDATRQVDQAVGIVAGLVLASLAHQVALALGAGGRHRLGLPHPGLHLL